MKPSSLIESVTGILGIIVVLYLQTIDGLDGEIVVAAILAIAGLGGYRVLKQYLEYKQDG